MVFCKDIMRPIRVSLRADDPVTSAIQFMRDSHMGLVPVVDDDGVFVGLLGGHSLMRAVRPKTLNIFHGMKRVSYLRENMDDVRERLDELGEWPIRDLVDTEVTEAHPDTPLIDALNLLAHNQNVVPVVDPETRVLLGAISFFSVLTAVLGPTGAEEAIGGAGPDPDDGGGDK